MIKRNKNRGFLMKGACKILNRLKINNSSWIPKRGEERGQTAAPKIGKTDR